MKVDEYIERSKRFWVFAGGPPGTPQDNEWHKYNEDSRRHVILMTHAEIGEVAGLFQKEYQGYKLDRDKLLLELGDVLWCCARYAEWEPRLQHFVLERIWGGRNILPGERDRRSDPWDVEYVLDDFLAWTPQTMPIEALIYALEAMAFSQGCCLEDLAVLNLEKLERRYASGRDGRMEMEPM